jgi:hypothetical protein
MRILVDTSVWSQAYRRKAGTGDATVAQELRELVREGRAEMAGCIRQELLSGIKHRNQFLALREALRAFPDVAVGQSDHERAAEHFNSCRARGIQGSQVDFLICALAERQELAIFTLDPDFELYRDHLPIELHTSRT